MNSQVGSLSCIRRNASCANLDGDPIAKQDELDRISAAHPHPSGATVQGSDGTTYNVRYH